jgi:predicted phage baseplate assembly protein
VVNVRWAAEDALPFPLCLWEVETPDEPSAGKQPVSLARGNIVLADHGRTITAQEQKELQVTESGRYRPRLQQTNVTHRTGYDHDTALARPAAEALAQSPGAALPAVTLREGDEEWEARRDLLSSDRFAREFVVEVDEEGYAYLRFGDDVLGMEPAGGARLQPAYRVGNGKAGNVGAEAISHVVTAQSGVAGVRNPLPAQGGSDPEPIEEVRLYAPQAFRTQERAVTEADYATAAERHSDVQKAIATRRWTGSWHTMFVTVDRKGGRRVDAAFESDLRAFLERFRLAGHDLEIEPPRLVPLYVALKVCVSSGYYRAVVKEALLEAFSNQDLPDGRCGFFHPDRFTFGQPVYLSQVVAAALEVPGVQWVDVTQFQRWGQAPLDEREKGRIPIGRLEIACLDNDPNAPENGKIEFDMEGGL